MRKTTVEASRKQRLVAAALFSTLVVAGADARAQMSEAELAKAALNPIAAMISLPLQYNYNQNYGTQRSGHQNDLNVQPVIPISLNEDWNVISRTIVPVLWQSEIFPGAGSQSGIGDITQSFFFSPKKLTESGWTWGVGPVIYIPSASNDLLGADKWGLGPTAVFLKQEHGWTVGMLANHIWSTGGSGRADISKTFLQPFLSYSWPSHTSLSLNTESTYDWKQSKWSVPIHLTVKQLFKIGNQAMQFEVGPRYWADSPDVGAHGWGVRATLTFLFPAKH
jgi:hypothetical protein